MLQRALKSYQTLQKETAVSAASPSQLIVLVYDRILDHLREARELIENGGDFDLPLQKSIDLIGEGLMAALDLERGGEIAANLLGIYEWSTRSLLRVRLRRDLSLLDDVVRVLTPLRDAWVVAADLQPTTV